MALRNTEHMSKCEKCRYYCRSGATFLFSHIGLCSLVFGYTVMGAFTFEALEAENERTKRVEIMGETKVIIDSLWELTSQSNVLNESNWSENATYVLSSYERKLVNAVRKDGFDGHFEINGTLQWSFSGALLYSIIVITTIGYGNIAPKTDAGKIVTILYAIVGIPLLLLCLSNIGDAMAHSFKFIYWKVCCYLCVAPKSHKKNRSNRSSRFPSGTLQSTTSTRDYDSLSKNMYAGAEMPNQYDRQRSYLSTISSQQSSPRNPHLHSHPSRESNCADAYKVPVISNKYVTNVVENNVSASNHRQHAVHQRLHNAMDSPMSYNPSSPFIRQQPKLQQDPMTSFSGMNTPINLDYGETLSVTSERAEDEDEGEEASVPIMLCISIVVGYICGGAMLFAYWENWDYSDSCYFCFITLTTIGFGDMVPGTAVLSEDAQLTLGLCSLYLLFGMALIAMSFNLVQEEVTKSVTSIGKRIGILSEDDDDDDDM